MEFKSAQLDGDNSSIKVTPSVEGGRFTKGVGIEWVAVGELVRISGISEAVTTQIEATGDLSPLGAYIHEDQERPGVYRLINGARASIIKENAGRALLGEDEELVETVPPQTAQFAGELVRTSAEA